MDKRELFETVASHLLTQNAKSVTDPDRGRCMYRGYDGRKCAVGILIKDEYYQDWLEENLVGSTIVDAAIQRSIGRDFLPGERSMLSTLQEVHDRCDVKDWSAKIDELRIKVFGWHAHGSHS